MTVYSSVRRSTAYATVVGAGAVIALLVDVAEGARPILEEFAPGAIGAALALLLMLPLAWSEPRRALAAGRPPAGATRARPAANWWELAMLVPFAALPLVVDQASETVVPIWGVLAVSQLLRGRRLRGAERAAGVTFLEARWATRRFMEPAGSS